MRDLGKGSDEPGVAKAWQAGVCRARCDERLTALVLMVCVCVCVCVCVVGPLKH
jgi:hypothetical protein